MLQFHHCDERDDGLGGDDHASSAHRKRGHDDALQLCSKSQGLNRVWRSN